MVFDLQKFYFFLSFQVLAFDRDIGRNAEIRYQIKSGKGRYKFKIDNATGMVYAQKGFEPGQEYELNVSKRLDEFTTFI